MKTKKEEKQKQLNFGLKNSPQNIYFKYKDQYEVWLAGLETKKFMKDILTWFTIILSITFIFTEIYLIETHEQLPSRIPIFNYFINSSKRLTVNELIYLYPFLSTLMLILTTITANHYYHKERSLSKILLVVMLLVNLSLCLIFLKLLYTF